MHFDIKDLTDVLLTAFSLYQTYRLAKSSGISAMFSGVVSFTVMRTLISQVLEIRLMGAILGKFINVGSVVLVTLFQDEIRHFLPALGSYRGWKFSRKLFSRRGDGPEKKGKLAAPAILAYMNMAWKKTGALIVTQQDMDLAIYEYTGEMFNTDINTRLIGNIFFRDSPLRDDAVIMADNRIRAVGYILSVAQNATLPKSMGLRHRSGLGMSLEIDVLVIIASEERGKIFVARKDKLSVNVTAEELQQVLSGGREVTDYY